MKGQKRVNRLAPRLRRTYDAIIVLEARLGGAPTIREIVGELNLNKRHISRVHGDVLLLERMGLVEKGPIPTRCYTSIGPAPDEVDWEALLLKEE